MLSEFLKPWFSKIQRSQATLCAFASQILASGGNFGATVILIRAMGLLEFGRYAIAFLLITMVRNFQVGAVLTPLSTIGPKLAPSSKHAYRGFLAAKAIAFGLATSILLLIGTAVAGWLFHLPWLVAVAFPLALANFTATMAEMLRRKLFVDGLHYAAVANDAIRYGLLLVLLVVCLVIRPKFLTCNSALLITSATSLAACLVSQRYFSKMEWRSTFSKLMLVRHWEMIRWLTPSVAFNTIQGPGAIFVASLFLGEVVVGGLRAMQNVTNMMLVPVNAMQNIAASQASRIYHDRGGAAMMRFLHKLSYLTVGTSVSLAILVYFCSDRIVEMVVGHPQPELNSLLILFCWVNVLSASQFVYSTGLQSVERPRAIAANSAVCAVASFVIVASLTKLIGAQIVPISRIVTLAIGNFALSRSLKKIVHGKGGDCGATARKESGIRSLHGVT